MILYRGLSVSVSEAKALAAKVGGRLSPRSHRWWATVEGVARVYATTGGGEVAVVLVAEYEGRPLGGTPALPALTKEARLTLRRVEVVG